MTLTPTMQIQQQQQQATRAAQRRLRQIEIENEQLMEEAEALKMTDEQHLILHRSFSSVKVEFSDLDGLSWQAQQQQPPKQFTVLTNTDHETIRPRSHPRTSFSSPNLSSSPSTDTINALLHNHRASSARSRSPIKGLFPSSASFDPYESDSERTIRGVQPKYTRASKRSHVSVSVSARSVAKRLANAVSPRKTSSTSSASSNPKCKSTSEPPSPPPVLVHSTSTNMIVDPPRTTSYPAYITYSTSQPPPTPLSSSPPSPSLSSASHNHTHTHIAQQYTLNDKDTAIRCA